MSTRPRLQLPRQFAARLVRWCLLAGAAGPTIAGYAVGQEASYSRWPRVETAQARESRSPAEMIPAPLPHTDIRVGMTLDEMLQVALSNSPTVRQASAALEGARGNWTQVGLYPNPGVGYLGNQIGDNSTTGQQGIYFQQEFVRGGKLALNREVAARELAIARQNLAAQQWRVVNDVRINFYNTLVAQQTLHIAEHLESIGKQGLDVAQQLLDAQQVGRVDVLQARIELSNAGIQVSNARNRLDAAWRQLAAVSAVPGMQPQQLAGDLDEDLPDFNWEESIARILQQSPELAATRSDVGRASDALRRARVEPVPNVTVQAAPQYDNNSGDTITNVSVFVPIPLFDYNQGGIRRAQADLVAARAAVRRHELLLTTRLATAFERYNNARQQVEQYNTVILPDAREALELVNRAYAQGETSFLVLLNAQRTYFYASLAALDAKRALWETAISIDGLLLTDNLQTGPTQIPQTPGVTPPSQLKLNPLLGH